ncbi:MAG: hypothetical protein ACD_46C00160G0003 [uncultured bacterium]|nr:MAG: hypothetical protein ACD_46C00160G0003 [uncultured bacterium]
MMSTSQLQKISSNILTWGMLLSTALVTFGGISFLFSYGMENLQDNILQANHYQISIWHIFKTISFASPINMIELGLACLVITQVIRVIFLFGYYIAIRDRYFIFISLFILLILIYSLFIRN